MSYMDSPIVRRALEEAQGTGGLAAQLSPNVHASAIERLNLPMRAPARNPFATSPLESQISASNPPSGSGQREGSGSAGDEAPVRSKSEGTSENGYRYSGSRQMPANQSSSNPMTEATSDIGSMGAPQDQLALAEQYGKQYGIDPRLLLAIAKHETGYGKLGAGHIGYTLGYGATDTGNIPKYSGVENQYREGAQWLARHGANTLDDIMAGKAADWATDPSWERGVASAYGTRMQQPLAMQLAAASQPIPGPRGGVMVDTRYGQQEWMPPASQQGGSVSGDTSVLARNARNARSTSDVVGGEPT